jgi:hypothetical protein
MIKAVFVQAGSDPPEMQYGEQVHSKLLSYFRLSEADVPLLEYNASSAHNPFRPFHDGVRQLKAPISYHLSVG